MFKSLFASALVAVSLFGDVAQAAPSECAMRSAKHTRTSIVPFTCDVHSRINANGHNVNDVTLFHNGRQVTVTVILWKDASENPTYAEMLHSGEREVGTWFRAKNGMYGVTDDKGDTLWFR